MTGSFLLSHRVTSGKHRGFRKYGFHRRSPSIESVLSRKRCICRLGGSLRLPRSPGCAEVRSRRRHANRCVRLRSESPNQSTKTDAAEPCNPPRTIDECGDVKIEENPGSTLVAAESHERLATTTDRSKQGHSSLRRPSSQMQLNAITRASVGILTCPKVSYPCRSADRRSLKGFDSCHDRIRRSSDSGPQLLSELANRSPPPYTNSASAPPRSTLGFAQIKSTGVNGQASPEQNLRS